MKKILVWLRAFTALGLVCSIEATGGSCKAGKQTKALRVVQCLRQITYKSKRNGRFWCDLCYCEYHTSSAEHAMRHARLPLCKCTRCNKHFYARLSAVVKRHKCCSGKGVLKSDLVDCITSNACELSNHPGRSCQEYLRQLEQEALAPARLALGSPFTPEEAVLPLGVVGTLFDTFETASALGVQERGEGSTV